MGGERSKRSTGMQGGAALLALLLTSCTSPQLSPTDGLEAAAVNPPRESAGRGAPVVKRSRDQRGDDTYAARELGLRRASETRSMAKAETVAPGDAARIVRVFYSTSRGLETSGSASYFNAARGEDLSYGFADVSIPPEHRMGAIERPSVWRFEREDTRKHVVVKTIYVADPDYFQDLLSEHSASSDKRALVFVHGFATALPDALMRSAQLKYDLAFRGPVVVFSWPSHGNALSYPPDAANAEWSQPLLERFLLEVARNPDINEITVLAFSMGAKLTASALARSLSTWPAEHSKKVVNVVLAAPDIDRDLFLRDHLPSLTGGGSRRVTLYASENDRALDISRRFHQVQRLGSMKPTPAVARGLDTIDATAVDTSLTGHAYYGDNRSVVSDLYYLIHEKLPPARRVTLRPAGDPKASYWRFMR